MNVVCPDCGHEFETQELQAAKKSPQNIMPKLKESICIECRKPITGDPLAFGGHFSCEPCVRRHYADQPAEVQEMEVRERKAAAARLLRLRRKA